MKQNTPAIVRGFFLLKLRFYIYRREIKKKNFFVKNRRNPCNRVTLALRPLFYIVDMRLHKWLHHDKNWRTP